MTQDEIRKVEHALRAADIFYYAILNGRKDGPFLGPLLADAIDIITKHGEALTAIDEGKERLDQVQADFDTVDSEAAGHLADKIELQKEIDELRKRIDLNA